MRKKYKANVDELVFGYSLNLDQWLLLVCYPNKQRVLPNNCFPKDEHLEEYLSRIHEFDDTSFRTLLRCFLNKSANYGCDIDRLKYIAQEYSVDELRAGTFRTEFDRRSIRTYGPQWEGITWVLDLLPRDPINAISVIGNYISAHMMYMTDNMFYGHSDAIEMIRARYNMINRYSCFISYGGPDEAFADKLYKSLTQHRIHTFFFPTNAVPGKRLHRVMRDGVNQHDRIILICSKASLDRPGFLNELTETLQREARDGGKEYLIPIRLDDYVFTNWAPEDDQLAQAVRDRVVADFSETIKDEVKYEMALQKLLTALDRPQE